MPPRTPSDMLSLAVTAIWSSTACLTAMHHPAGHLGPVLQRAAELVVAAVDQRTQKRTRQIVVTQMHFDGIESGVDGQPGRVGVRGDHIVDVVAAGLLGEPHADRVEEPHRRQRRGLVGAGVGDRAGMSDLRADRRTFGVDRIGEPPEPGHGFRAHPDPVAFGAAALGDRAVGHRGHADPAGGRQPVVLDQVVADQRAGRAGFEGRGFDDAVAQRDGPELRRCQHVRGFGHVRSLWRSQGRRSRTQRVAIDRPKRSQGRRSRTQRVAIDRPRRSQGRRSRTQRVAIIGRGSGAAGMPNWTTWVQSRWTAKSRATRSSST